MSQSNPGTFIFSEICIGNSVNKYGGLRSGQFKDIANLKISKPKISRFQWGTCISIADRLSWNCNGTVEHTMENAPRVKFTVRLRNPHWEFVDLSFQLVISLRWNTSLLPASFSSPATISTTSFKSWRSGRQRTQYQSGWFAFSWVWFWGPRAIPIIGQSKWRTCSNNQRRA